MSCARKAKGGTTEEANLWVACRACNEFKGIQTQALDSISDQVVPIFNPRAQKWHEHFEWSSDGSQILGITAIGRATVDALNLNHKLIVHARRLWAKIGWHSPEEK